MEKANMSKEVAEIISNPTCRKIIEYLKQKPSSEADISKALNLPASTVNYNIQKLVKNSFIEVKDFLWSEKGNKINIYQNSDKMFVFSHSKPKYLENRMKVVMFSIIPILLVMSFIIYSSINLPSPQVSASLEKFSSCSELNDAFKEAQSQSRGYGMLEGTKAVATGIMTTASQSAAESADSGAREYSETNVQVEGVDEADIVKTDGNYIYTITKGKLVITKAYPAAEAELVSTTEIKNFYPNEIFIDKDRLLVFGTSYEEIPMPVPMEQGVSSEKASIYPYYPTVDIATAKLYDISDRKNPILIKTVDIEGNYLSSRKIGEYVYFVINSYPRYYLLEGTEEANNVSDDIVPMFREQEADENKSLAPACGCADVEYIAPINPESFITLAAISMQDENAEVQKKVIVGSGENVYASLSNFYIAQMNHPYWFYWTLRAGESIQENTIIYKFSLDKQNIEYKGSGQVPGHILNQFSMDEYDNYFRIATTKGQVWRGNSTNNVYVLNENLNITGRLEDLAQGETIYSVRFMGARGYIVTFKKIDPLFVIDLSNPEAPAVLGKLKIPGYSDYLHPYDENHIIGIGKEAVDAETGELISRDFAWYQGMKLALFDVSDVSNPVEMYKITIGDRGTNSDALHDHKAFLFDKDKNLLVIPILLAEIKNKETAEPSSYGDYIFQGAYVYKLTLENGFELKGRVTHYDTNESFLKSGYYFYGDESIQRSLYIDNVLYTISQSKIKANSLDNLEMIKEIVLYKKKQCSRDLNQEECEAAGGYWMSTVTCAAIGCPKPEMYCECSMILYG